MDNARYLPASRVEAGSRPLGCLSVMASDNREIGKLVGFVIDDHQIRSLVVESDDSNIEVPMGPVQFDQATGTLRIVQPNDGRHAFAVDSLPQVTTDDLWVPFFHSAA